MMWSETSCRNSSGNVAMSINMEFTQNSPVALLRGLERRNCPPGVLGVSIRGLLAVLLVVNFRTLKGEASRGRTAMSRLRTSNSLPLLDAFPEIG